MEGYTNIHLLPMYQKKIAYGSKGFPWRSDICRRDINYKKGICPIAEDLHDNSFLSFAMCLHEFEGDDIELVVKAFKKIWGQLNLL